MTALKPFMQFLFDLFRNQKHKIRQWIKFPPLYRVFYFTFFERFLVIWAFGFISYFCPSTTIMNVGFNVKKSPDDDWLNLAKVLN